MLEAIRPDSWNVPLFLHVLGAMTTAGGLLATGTLAVAARRDTGHAAALSRLAMQATLLVVLPAWIVMRLAGQWVLDRENLPDGTGWVDVGLTVTDVGIVVIIALAAVAILAARRAGVGRLTTAVAGLSGLYLAAMVVAWFAMTAKP